MVINGVGRTIIPHCGWTICSSATPKRLTPALAADIKRTAEEALMNRLETISSGERLSLAHRASGRIAAELLCDTEPRVIHGALDNSRLTEAEVIRALMRADAPVLLVESVCAHAKWSLRRDIRIALLRNENTPLVRMIEFGRSLLIRLLREILRSRSSRLPARTREYLLKEIDQRDADS